MEYGVVESEAWYEGEGVKAIANPHILCHSFAAHMLFGGEGIKHVRKV